MKATLTYDLPDERTEFMSAIHGQDWESIVWTFDQWLRAEIKYNDKPWQSVRDQLYQIKNEHGLEFSE